MSIENIKKTILIVEDEFDVNKLIKRILALKGYTACVSAYNGKEAIEILKSIEPILIITDRMMPEMDGITMLQIVKQEERLCSIPVIILSAVRERDEAISSLFDDYILKPIEISMLLNSVEKLIGLQYAG